MLRIFLLAVVAVTLISTLPKMLHGKVETQSKKISNVINHHQVTDVNLKGEINQFFTSKSDAFVKKVV